MKEYVVQWGAINTKSKQTEVKANSPDEAEEKIYHKHGALLDGFEVHFILEKENGKVFYNEVS